MAQEFANKGSKTQPNNNNNQFPSVAAAQPAKIQTQRADFTEAALDREKLYFQSTLAKIKHEKYMAPESYKNSETLKRLLAKKSKSSNKISGIALSAFGFEDKTATTYSKKGTEKLEAEDPSVIAAIVKQSLSL